VFCRLSLGHILCSQFDLVILFSTQQLSATQHPIAMTMVAPASRMNLDAIARQSRS
jgi:hypothetical protein